MKVSTKELCILFFSAAVLSLSGCSKEKSAAESTSNQSEKTQSEVASGTTVIEETELNETEKTALEDLLIEDTSTITEENAPVLPDEDPRPLPAEEISMLLPQGDASKSQKFTEKGLLTPLPFTYLYGTPNDTTPPVYFASGFYKAADFKQEDTSWYFVTFAGTEYSRAEKKGYIQADKVIEDSCYAYNINEAEILDEKGKPTGEMLPAHTLLAWNKDENELSTVYTFDDNTITKIYIKSGNLCNDYSDIQMLFKYKQVKAVKDIEDPLLYDLKKETIAHRFFDSAYDRERYQSYNIKTNLVRKETKALVNLSAAYYKHVDWDSYGIADRLYSPSDAEKLQQYLNSDDIQWGVFAKPSIRVSGYDPMCFTGDDIIEAGTLAAEIPESNLYFYVDSKTGTVMGTSSWVQDYRPVMRNDFKDELKTFAEICRGNLSNEETKEAFWNFFDSDKDYTSYNDPKFISLVKQYRDANYGTDYSDQVEDYSSCPVTFTVAAKDGVSANVYSRPGTIGTIVGKAENGKVLKPLKVAKNLIPTYDDVFTQDMYFYFEIPGEENEAILNGWISAGEVKYTEDCRWFSESKNQYYGGKKDEIAGSSEEEVRQGGKAEHFHTRPDALYTDGSVRDYLREYLLGQDPDNAYVHNPDFYYVITDDAFGNEVCVYADKELTKQSFTIPDLTALKVLSLSVDEIVFAKESTFLPYSVQIIYEEKAGWIDYADLYFREKPFILNK